MTAKQLKPLSSDGVLSSANGDMVIKPCTKAEVEFYQACAARNEPLLQYMPRFMGTLQLSTPEQRKALEAQQAAVVSSEADPGASSSIDGTATTLALDDPGPLKGKKLETEQAIVLENAAAGFVKPNIIDLKLGARLWDDGAPPAKRQRLDDVASKTTSGSLGFRIAGMRVWNAEKQDFDTYDKLYGRKFNAETVTEGFEEYFGFRNKQRQDLPERRSVLDIVKADVASVLSALEVTELRMYSASILIAYEGDAEALKRAIDAHAAEVDKAKAEDDGESATSLADDGSLANIRSADIDKDDGDAEDAGPKMCRVVLIDFAHARFVPGEGRDANVLQGVENVLNILERLG